jgi:hypothetical protein
MSTDSALLEQSRQSSAADAFAPTTGTLTPGVDGETRVYRGRSIDELIPRIEAELGADAIVVRRRRGLEGGIGGFFQRPFVEVEAKAGTPRFDMYDEGLGEPALPPALRGQSTPNASPSLPPPAPGSTPMPAVPRPAGAYVTDTLATIAAAGSPQPVVEDPPALPLPRPMSEPPAFSPPQPMSEPSALSLTQPVSELPEEFHELTPDTFGAALVAAEQSLPAEMPAVAEQQQMYRAGMSTAPEAVPPSSPAPMPGPTPDSMSDPLGEELDMLDRGMRDLQVAGPLGATVVTAAAPHARARERIEQSLLDVGVSREMAAELLDAAIAHILPFAPRTSLVKAVHGALTARIPSIALLPARDVSVAVVGGGGSGKTSCCAALLGAYRKVGSLPASCATVTLVGERGEPAMLLSPRIMQPLAIASPQARQALAQARAEGMLLLDMPPLSPAERPAIRQIATLLGEMQPDRVVVALPATLGAKAAAQLLTAMRPLGATALAITHADETDQLGVAVEAACKFGLAPEYLLDRGRVRGGLTRIDPTQLANRLLP